MQRISPVTQQGTFEQSLQIKQNYFVCVKNNMRKVHKTDKTKELTQIAEKWRKIIEKYEIHGNQSSREMWR